jgi:hypothetical protein
MEFVGCHAFNLQMLKALGDQVQKNHEHGRDIPRKLWMIGCTNSKPINVEKNQP